MQIISQLKLFPRLLTPFAKSNKGEGLTKQRPSFIMEFHHRKEKHFSVFEKQKNMLGSRVKNIGKLK